MVEVWCPIHVTAALARSGIIHRADARFVHDLACMHYMVRRFWNLHASAAILMLWTVQPRDRQASQLGVLHSMVATRTSSCHVVARRTLEHVRRALQHTRENNYYHAGKISRYTCAEHAEIYCRRICIIAYITVPALHSYVEKAEEAYHHHGRHQPCHIPKGGLVMSGYLRIVVYMPDMSFCVNLLESGLIWVCAGLLLLPCRFLVLTFGLVSLAPTWFLQSSSAVGNLNRNLLENQMHHTMLQMCAAPICAAHRTSQVQILASVPGSCTWHA